MPTWTLSVDRRKTNRDAVVDELKFLEASVKDLTVDLVEEADFLADADGGAFRDFTALAHISHPSEAGLEYVAETLLETFGWNVDFRPPAE